MSKQIRCSVTTTFYIWVESDQEAIDEAKEMAYEQRYSNDDNCTVKSIVEHLPVSLESREIYNS